MLAARKALALTKSLAGQNGFQLRTSAISGPARVKISGAEKAVHGLLISVGLMFYPGWVLVHLPSYKGAE